MAYLLDRFQHGRSHISGVEQDLRHAVEWRCTKATGPEFRVGFVPGLVARWKAYTLSRRHERPQRDLARSADRRQPSVGSNGLVDGDLGWQSTGENRSNWRNS